ncbi:MAG: hypothetical protein EXS63_02935 [Candidatus Omnitrophica bacterium]|nr:hypothetical protein [Candidatus Omnitrophota bacterium]
MKKNEFLFLLAVILFSGCGKLGIQARYHLFKAEQFFFKANYSLRSKNVPFEERKPLFVQACNEYMKTFQLDAGAFSAEKIEEASQSCSSAGNREASESLDDFYRLYCQDHPKECEYGFMPSNPELSEF